jgi:hypothetical protein
MPDIFVSIQSIVSQSAVSVYPCFLFDFVNHF